MQELYDLYKRNFPFCVRAESAVRRLLNAGTVLEERTGAGKLIGAAVLDENNILMLCVDPPYRHRGIGSRLLEKSEQLVKSQEYSFLTVGAGRHYLMPGVPTDTMPVTESLLPAKLYDGLDNAAVEFFCKWGYRHNWDCNCFDMRLELAEFSVASEEGDVVYRWAKPEDLPAVICCTDDAHQEFSRYYQNGSLYTGFGDQRVLIAETDGRAAGALIVSFETEGKGLGSVGCTAVSHGYRGQHIGMNLVIHGTEKLKDAGLEHAFLGYTYSGLDRMYGHAGYQICVYYFMAQKDL